MSPEVAGDHVPPAGAVWTGGTLVRFLPCVSPLVGGEVVRPAEDLPAHLAAVGLVPGVEPHVAGQHVTAGEGSLADLTEVGSASSTNTRVRGARLTTITVNSSVQITRVFQSFSVYGLIHLIRLCISPQSKLLDPPAPQKSQKGKLIIIRARL